MLLDIYDFSLEKYLTYKINSLGYKVFDKYEKENFGNGIADFSEVFATLDEAEKSFEEINENVDYLWKKYRDGIKSSGGLTEAEKERRKTLVSNIKQSIEANRGCGVLYLDTVTPDGFGSPKMKIIVKYAGENAESELYFGSVKPEAVTFDLGGVAAFRRREIFRLRRSKNRRKSYKRAEYRKVRHDFCRTRRKQRNKAS